MTEPFEGLCIERFVDAPPTSVWQAWTTEEGLARWWWAGWSDTTHRVDLRVGGGYRFASPTAGIAVHGEYLLVEPPQRIEMTWIWSDDGEPGPTEHVSVELEPNGAGTTVRVRHTGPWTSASAADDYRDGWHHVLARLADTST